MGLLNYIKGTIKENYDLEDIEDIEDIDDFVYDDEQNLSLIHISEPTRH